MLMPPEQQEKHDTNWDVLQMTKAFEDAEFDIDTMGNAKKLVESNEGINQGTDIITEKVDGILNYLRKYNYKISYQDALNKTIKVENRNSGNVASLGTSYRDDGVDSYVTEIWMYDKSNNTHTISKTVNHNNYIAKGMDRVTGTSSEKITTFSPNADELLAFLGKVERAVEGHEHKILETQKQIDYSSIDKLKGDARLATLKRMLERDGLTSEREMSTLTLKARTILYNTIPPNTGVQENSYERGKQLDSLFDTCYEKLKSHDRVTKNASERGFDTCQSEDMWSFYLGLPQEYNTLGISDFKPTRKSNTGEKEEVYYKLNDPNMKATIWNALTTPQIQDANKIIALQLTISNLQKFIVDNEDSQDPSVQGKIDEYKYHLEVSKNKLNAELALPKSTDDIGIDFINKGMVYPYTVHANDLMLYHPSGEGTESLRGLGNFSLSLGKDSKGSYIAYYDKYDFHIPDDLNVGKAYELYDRIYYDPTTMECLDSEVNKIIDF